VEHNICKDDEDASCVARGRGKRGDADLKSNLNLSGVGLGTTPDPNRIEESSIEVGPSRGPESSLTGGAAGFGGWS